MGEPGPSGWQESDSLDFIELGRFFVPQREAQLELMASLVPPGGAFSVLELCCGGGELAEHLLERHPQCTLVGMDKSEAMLEVARTRLLRFGGRFQGELFDLGDDGWRHGHHRAIVSSLAVHHLEDAAKRSLYADLLGLLEPGGALVIADVVQPQGEAALAAAAAAWDEEVRARALRLSGSLRAYERFQELEWNSFRLLRPDPDDHLSPLASQLRWLEQAGYREVDVHWALAGHAIFGGRRDAG